MLYDTQMPNVWNNVGMPSFVHLTMNFTLYFFSSRFIYLVRFFLFEGNRNDWPQTLQDLTKMWTRFWYIFCFIFLLSSEFSFFFGLLCCVLVFFLVLFGNVSLCMRILRLHFMSHNPFFGLLPFALVNDYRPFI